MDDKLGKNAEVLGNILLKKQLFISFAESCTGGLLGSSLISIPGSSKWVSQGFITYSNVAKIKFLGVSKKTLEDFGAVDTKVTDEMVRGVLNYDLADVAIAISGIAGPTGGSKSKPVGTVCISIGNQNEILSKQHFFEGDRNQVREQSAEMALIDTINFLKNID
ncbi:MAG: damage-inducible protein CinA [Gammaproteobacteria bacterium]|nr:damage-inducible protein CinA [Gammaproteobacteria bacterium]|tara:strand:- start:1212 stop:1703 length:492 start_codon:yes stop_codon:yes gene_type:complete